MSFNEANDFSVAIPDVSRNSRRTCGGFSCLPRFLRLSFSPASLEQVYQRYFLRQRQDTLLVLVVFAALFNCYVIIMCAVVFTPDKMPMVAAAAAGLVADAVLYALCRFHVLPQAMMHLAVPFSLWLLITLHVLLYVGFNFAGFNEAGDAVGWQTFFTFSFFLTMPLPLAHILALALLTCCAHTTLLAVLVPLRMLGGLQSSVLVRQVRNTNAQSGVEPNNQSANTNAIQCYDIIRSLIIWSELCCHLTMSDRNKPQFLNVF